MPEPKTKRKYRRRRRPGRPAAPATATSSRKSRKSRKPRGRYVQLWGLTDAAKLELGLPVTPGYVKAPEAPPPPPGPVTP